MNKDTIRKMIDYESGSMTDEVELVDFFQELIDSRTIMSLQGSYQRVAQDFVEVGWCKGFDECECGVSEVDHVSMLLAQV